MSGGPETEVRDGGLRCGLLRMPKEGLIIGGRPGKLDKAGAGAAGSLAI